MVASGVEAACATLDGVVLELKYRRGPMFEPVTGWAVVAAGCPLFSASGAAGLALHGTLYAPTGAASIALANVSNS